MSAGKGETRKPTDPIGYITPEIPEFELPPHEGDRYEGEDDRGVHGVIVTRENLPQNEDRQRGAIAEPAAIEKSSQCP